MKNCLNMVSTKKTIHRLVIRNATVDDIEQISDVIERVYEGMPPYPKDKLKAQILNFPEGCFVAESGKIIVGYCASLRIAPEKALKPHTWREITGGGYGTTHERTGEVLYGYEVCVDPEFRNLRIGERFYNERKKLARHLRLRGIVFAGRVSRLAEKIEDVGSVEKYVELVKKKKIQDPSLSFQFRNGFEVAGVFKDYLPLDKESLGYGILLMWKNPSFEEIGKIQPGPRRVTNDIVRVATVQYRQRRIRSFKEFEEMVRYFVDVVADYKSDFVVFPELFSLQLLSIENEQQKPHQAIEKMTKYTDDFKAMFRKMAIKYNINIIGGSHPTKVGDKIQNISYVFLRDGTVVAQPKIHPTPNERYWWNIEGGDYVSAIQTDCGPIGVLVCYDTEFPELTRHLVNQGIRILFVPFLTDERQGYCRVRYCCQARAVENQIYVAMSGSVGNLPNVNNIDIHYAQSCILTPCDFSFARDGVAADTTPNVETVAIADLRMDSLMEARSSGTVRNLKDRRHDLYSVKWHGKSLGDEKT